MFKGRHKQKKTPPRLAEWTIKRLCPPSSAEPLLGDLSERYQAGRSDLWYWRQAIIAISAEWPMRNFVEGRLAMKRVVIWMFALICMFSFGFWTGRNRLFAPVDAPSLVNLERNIEKGAAETAQNFRTLEFLRMELAKAQSQNVHEKTSESQARVDQLRQKLEYARRAVRHE